MTRAQFDQAEEAPEETGAAMPAGYDGWKLATPPELEDRPRPRPCWADGMPAGSCGRAIGSHCTLPAGHHHQGSPCNSLAVRP